VSKAPLLYYKYRSVDEYGLRFISHNEAFYANHTLFNDPYELEFNVIVSERPDLDVKLDKIENIIPKIKNNIQGCFHKDIGFLSLSTLNNQILMWSHYSDSHAGICVGMSSLSLQKETLKAIKYSKNLYTVKCELDEKGEGIKVPIDNDEYLIGICNTKCDIWSYENEWRDVNRKSGVKILPEDAILEVILGFKITEKNRLLVIKALNERRNNFKTSPPIKLLKAEPNMVKYELEIHDTGDIY